MPRLLILVVEPAPDAVQMHGGDALCNDASLVVLHLLPEGLAGSWHRRYPMLMLSSRDQHYFAAAAHGQWSGCFWPPWTRWSRPAWDPGGLYFLSWGRTNIGAGQLRHTRCTFPSLVFIAPAVGCGVEMVPLNRTFFCSTMETPGERTSRL